MPILQAHPKPKFTLEEARASGRLIEYESAGVTYAYTPDNRWINGHEWASPREIEEKTEDWQRPKPTRSWLVAQCLWWNLWRPGLKCPRDLTKVHLASALYDRIMGGGELSIHPKSVWEALKVAWNEKFGDVATGIAEASDDVGRDPDPDTSTSSHEETYRNPEIEYVHLPSGGGMYVLDLTNKS